MFVRLRDFPQPPEAWSAVSGSGWNRAHLDRPGSSRRGIKGILSLNVDHRGLIRCRQYGAISHRYSIPRNNEGLLMAPLRSNSANRALGDAVLGRARAIPKHQVPICTKRAAIPTTLFFGPQASGTCVAFKTHQSP
jgi:hypothetical protein